MPKSKKKDSFPEFEGSLELREKIEAVLFAHCKKDSIDWKGHFENGKFGGRFSKEKFLEDTVNEALLLGLLRGRVLPWLVDAIDEGKLLNEPLMLSRVGDDTCYVCGQRTRLGFDGQRLVLIADPCPYPNGIVTEWELNVPSGKLVVANDLRKWFPIDEDYSVNPVMGQHLMTLAYAKVGMAHGFVGNTCPGVFRIGDRFVIGSYQEELWDEEKDEGYLNPEPCPWGEEVASVCTDLWWFSIVDLDELVRRLPHYTPDTKLEEVLEHAKVVDVRPGVYKFRQVQGVDRDAPLVEYATFEWAREPDEVHNYIAEEKAKCFTAIEVLIEKCLEWPTLYMGMTYQDPLKDDRAHAVAQWEAKDLAQKTAALALAADHLMCTIGGGVEWHENGFPRCAVREDARRLAAEFDDVPAFCFDTHWYPISRGYGGLCLGAGLTGEFGGDEPIHLAPSFVRLGLNICQNAIRFGEEPRLNTDVWPPAFEVPHARERMRLFIDCYRGLRSRYPEEVYDADFDRWMSETDLECYVANFDFGPDLPPKRQWGKRPTTVKRGAFFEFDARILNDGNFCWHPKEMGGAWAKKEDAQCYRLGILAGTESPLGHLHVEHDPVAEAVPLRVVGRVLRGSEEGVKSKHLEVAFDYGTESMRTERWALGAGEMPAVRQFDDEAEYATLLEQCKIEFIDREKSFDV